MSILTACDKDQHTSPTPKPTTAKDSLGQGGAVTDNQWPDSDPWDGGLQRSLPHPGTWTVCQTSAPTGFVMPAGQPCHKVVIN